MQRHLKLAGTVAIGVGLAGCSDFLTGPGLTENPNAPITASKEQLFIGMQARQFVFQEGQMARLTAMWTQQVTGIFNQQLEYGSKYLITENDVSTHYNHVYVGGGLQDMRKILADPTADARLQGIVKVWEALTIGTATSLWGDLPYREAANTEIFTPALDPQQQIYADVQALLDNAITQLGTASSTPALPQDLVYAGDVARWRRAANTLKARYHLHTAPRLGAAAYAAAIAAANQGINEAPANATLAANGQAPGDFRTFHGTTLDDANIWAQFLSARADIVAGKRLVDVLVARGNDPRLAAYFDPASDAVYRGADQWGAGTNSSLVDLANRAPRPFRQPLVSWTENQLILAEAHFQSGNPGQALIHVNNVRTALGMPTLAAVTLEDIMTEKWIAQFQNIDAYSDWRRTCFPRLVPGGPTAGTPAGAIPGRVVYGSSERLQNPNVPAPAAQPAKNWNYAQITCPTTIS
jgi:starch-binding outer membrane protein, SusD/RagB family